MPPLPLRLPQSGDPFGLEELHRAYNVYHGTPPHDLVGALWEHFQGVHPDRCFAVTLLTHVATNICVQQLQALLPPGQRTPDNLINVRIRWFTDLQPDQERIWVPQLAWAQTLIAPPTGPQPAPSPRGRERAAPQLSAHALNIPPYNGIAA